MASKNQAWTEDACQIPRSSECSDRNEGEPSHARTQSNHQELDSEFHRSFTRAILIGHE